MLAIVITAVNGCPSGFESRLSFMEDEIMESDSCVEVLESLENLLIRISDQLDILQRDAKDQKYRIGCLEERCRHLSFGSRGSEFE